MAYTIRLDRTTWAHQLGPVGDLKYTLDEHGPLDATWRSSIPNGFQHPAVYTGAVVEIFYCGIQVWHGSLLEPNAETWDFTAVGGAKRMADIAAVHLVIDPPNADTFYRETDLDILISQAQSRGFDDIKAGPNLPAPVTYPDGFTVKDVLDIHTGLPGLHWWVDEQGELAMLPDPATITEPTWALTPGVPALGVTSENYYSRTFIVFPAADHLDETTFEPLEWVLSAAALPGEQERWGARERVFEWTGEPIGDAAAQTAVDRLQAEAVAAPTESVQVSQGQVTTLGGTAAPLAFIKPWQMVRHFGVLDSPGARNPHHWIVGRVEIDTKNQTAVLSPRNVAPRTFEAVMALQKQSPDQTEKKNLTARLARRN